jgi:hypothetical protein
MFWAPLGIVMLTKGMCPTQASAAKASSAKAPAASPQQQATDQGLLPISSLLDQGQALLPSWLPSWGGRRMLRAAAMTEG